ncbi:MAG: radical SAM protein [Peptoanaerobacter stomatis]|uniref:radical SAM protein n=1 Tax=Peptoanaerobacter stomatis TaxID=796937 RepID=UPI003F9FF4D1
MKKITIILKPTLLCNSQCKYCITPHNSPSTKMSISVFDILCKKIAASEIYDNFYFLWHGGEPLLMGREFFNRCFEIQKKYLCKKKYTNTIQSNCTLIDEDWIHWLKEHKIRISTSLDGTKHLHDINRIKAGNGTFDEVFSAVKELKEQKLLNGVVTVLSKTNIAYIDEILNFFSQNGIKPRLNPIFPSETSKNNPYDLSITPVEYAKVLNSAFDNWLKSKYSEDFIIPPLNEIIHNFFANNEIHLCNFTGKCSDSFIAINPNGDLYNCGRFCDVLNYKIGNISDDIHFDLIFEKKRNLIKWETDENDKCTECKWFNVCNRGCPYTSYLENGKILNNDMFCEAYKIIFSHIYKRLKDEINGNAIKNN